MRFWLEKGVDGFRLDTVNFYFHDALLRSDPADDRDKDEPEIRPYEMQYHKHSKNQPENLEFLRRVRNLMDEYDARTTVGEIGDSHHGIEMMGGYTTGGRLHMAYSFNMLAPDFSARHFRSQVETFFEEAPQGWPCWAFSNHDVVRHMTRWADHGADQDRLAKLAAALLLSLEGSICLYQGEELGQTETVLTYDEITDPTAIAFWPDDKGRDGCRTPMVWDDGQANAGFSKANSTWLPVKPTQSARAANTQIGQTGSVLSFYKEMLALRKSTPSLQTGTTEFINTDEPVLAFRRGGTHLCVFNLSAQPQAMAALPEATPNLWQDAEIDNNTLRLGPNGFWIATLSDPGTSDAPVT